MTLRISKLPSAEEMDKAALDRVERRRETGRALVAVAEQLKQIQSETEKLTKQYAEAYKDAITDSWTANELSAHGLPQPVEDKPRQRRRRKTTDTATTESSGE